MNKSHRPLRGGSLRAVQLRLLGLVALTLSASCQSGTSLMPTPAVLVNTAMTPLTAVSPKSRLLIGYVWDTKDYPWLNLWRHVENGRPAARGLEFGTTGLHQPFGEMVRRGGRLFETPLFAYLDSGEVHERSYRAFLRAASAGSNGVSKVRVMASGGIEITYS